MRFEDYHHYSILYNDDGSIWIERPENSPFLDPATIFEYAWHFGAPRSCRNPKAVHFVHKVIDQDIERAREFRKKFARPVFLTR